MAQPQHIQLVQHEASTSRKRRWWLLLLLLLLLIGWAVWPNGRLAKAKELQDQLFSDASQALSPEERREKFGQLRELTGQLSESHRRELQQNMMKQRQADLERYTQLSPAEKKQRLDRDINRQEQSRQRMQQNPRSSSGGPPSAGAAGQGRSSTPEDRERRRQQRLDRTTPEYRELTDQYRRDLELRRRERGLAPSPTRPAR